jgi:hypothetical protein
MSVALAGLMWKTPKPLKNKSLPDFCQPSVLSGSSGGMLAQLRLPHGLKTNRSGMVDLDKEIVKLGRSRLYIVADTQ